MGLPLAAVVSHLQQALDLLQMLDKSENIFLQKNTLAYHPKSVGETQKKF